MSITDIDLDYLSTLVANRTGNVISTAQAYLLESRLNPVAKEAGLPDLHSLVEELKRAHHSPMHDRVADAMTINETSFFRDADVFEAIASDIVPELIKTRGIRRELRIWCGACSSGQEPYTLAIMLSSRFPELATWDVKITATDYSERILERAKTGAYSQFEVNRGLPAPLLVKYFQRQGLNWVVKPEIRERIEFKRLNLLSPFPHTDRFDLVLLRNVLIYFTPDDKSKILTKVRDSLADDGHLFLGGGESMVNISAPFTREVIGRAVTYRPV
jgi:chemotaxis protein methyltransferase CheR